MHDDENGIGIKFIKSIVLPNQFQIFFLQINGSKQLDIEVLKSNARVLTLGNTNVVNLVHEIGQKCSSFTDDNE